MKSSKEFKIRADHLLRAISYLDQLSDDDLRELLMDCCRVTTTNCGWHEYELAPLLKKEIEVTQSIRARAKPATAGAEHE